jgi:hypothetical protein
VERKLFCGGLLCKQTAPSYLSSPRAREGEDETNESHPKPKPNPRVRRGLHDKASKSEEQPTHALRDIAGRIQRKSAARRATEAGEERAGRRRELTSAADQTESGRRRNRSMGISICRESSRRVESWRGEGGLFMGLDSRRLVKVRGCTLVFL